MRLGLPSSQTAAPFPSAVNQPPPRGSERRISKAKLLQCADLPFQSKARRRNRSPAA